MVGKGFTAARMSELYTKPGPNASVLKQKTQNSKEAYFADAPMYSSFARDGVFPR